MQDENLVSVMTVENAAWRFNYLAIARTPKFLRATATVRMIGELPDVAEGAFDNLRGSDRVLQRNVVGDGVKISQRRL